MEKQTRIAIAASLVWMAVATFLILGTHGPSLAHADTGVEGAADAAGAEWMALPAAGADVRVIADVDLQC